MLCYDGMDSSDCNVVRHVLKNLGTVISIHEDLGQKNPPRADIKAMRAHTLTVLSQLSKEGYAEAGSVSIVSVRQSLHDGESGVRDEGAGNLFYYLFDDWNATFVLIITMKKKLEELVSGYYPVYKFIRLIIAIRVKTFWQDL